MRLPATLFLIPLAACAQVGSPAGPEADGPPTASAAPVLTAAELGLPEIADAQALADALLDAGLRDHHAYAMLSKLCETAPHRLAGSQGYNAAILWGERAMRDAGLANVRREGVMAKHWVRGAPEVVTMNSGLLGAQPLAAAALGGSVGTPPGGITAQVVEVQGIGDLLARAAKGESFAGKIVFFNEAMDPTARSTFQAYGKAVQQRSRGAIEASKLGGVAALVRSMSTKWDDQPHTGAMRSLNDVEQIPALALGILSAEALSAGLRADTVESVTIEAHCQTLPDKRSWNVIGEIVGSQFPDEVLVVGGHLDSWDKGQGAHDDGGGCAASIEAARLLVECGVKPKRTIRVVLFANEENGLAGGRGYAEAHGAKDKHLLAIESDGGSFAPRGIALSLSQAAVDRLRPLGMPLAAVGAERVLLGGGGADIGPLQAHGCKMGSLRVEDSRYFDVHHSDNDTLDQVSPRELELGAVVMAYWLALLANADPAALG
ncbi:MAG: M20/M25/M40 family metallo-hydrolase [Planctomycetes bacterium]|nr:M20/M25/M40 family metallo-hydrolase [Planctomycetota bacterium]